MAELSGIVIVNKPSGYTSHDVVGRMRGILKMRRIGHTGTLDPEATGVLPVCIGKATKAAELLTAGEKEYIADVTLGSATDTQDSAGTVTESADMDDLTVTDMDIKSTAGTFIGDIEQIPPMYSAVKVGGKKLYELARRGIEVERRPRHIHISQIEILDVYPHVDRASGFKMRVVCSKGTYIRTLCDDIGRRLGCFAHMSGLIRTRSGRFWIDDALTLEEIEHRAGTGDLSFILPVDTALDGYEKIVLTERAAGMCRNGVMVRCPRPLEEGALCRVYDAEGALLTVSRVKDARLKIIKTFY